MTDQEKERETLMAQLANAVNMAIKQDQITWAICTVYVGAASVLVVALFNDNGHLVPPGKGLAICLPAFGMSHVLFAILRRAFKYFAMYETVVQKLEEKLAIPTEFSVGQRPDGDSSRDLLDQVGNVMLGVWGVLSMVFGIGVAASVFGG